MIYNKAPFDPELTASTGTYYQGIDYFMRKVVSERHLSESDIGHVIYIVCKH